MSGPAQRSFTAGELSPALHARPNLAAYQQGLETCRNALVMKTGGVQSRPGTAYKGGIKGNTWARLVPCVFDDDQNYLLEFGNGTLRFWRNGTQITGTVTGAWADVTAYAAGIVVSYSGTNYVSLVAHTSALATNRPSTGSSWQTYWYALSGTIYELPTPWTTQTIVRQLQTQVEAADGSGVMRIAHNTTLRRKLTRLADAQWTFSTLTSSVTLDFPTNLATDAPTPGDVAAWCVTAYDSVNGIESLASSPVSSDTAPASPGSVFTQTWDAVTGATSYRVYRSDNLSVFGFLYETTSTSFIDTGVYNPDTSRTPPEEAADFSASGDYPGVIGAYQQRVLVSGSTNEPSTVRASRAGQPDDFTVSSPLVDSDAVTWTMVGDRVVRPRHFLEVAQRLVQFSNIDEKVIEGDDTGIISPGGVNPRRISANGAATYPSPLPVNDTALYVQARGGIVRDLLADAAGSDLSLSAAHLLTGYTIPEWCYQQTPNSIVWMVRSDGTLLSLTYQRESGVAAWARHDTDGTFESVACVPESTEDVVYVIVNRTINSGTVRYLERLTDRGTAIASYVGCDAATVTTMAHPHSSLSITGGSSVLAGDGWLHSGETATGSGGTGSFTSADVGRTFSFVYNSIRGYGRITGYTSGTVVTVNYWWPDATDLTNPQVFTTANWWWTSVVGLTHLALEPVSVVGDGTVVASPNNPAVTPDVTVTSGGIAVIGGLDSGSGNIASLTATGDASTAQYTTTVIGLPFVTDLVTLDIDTSRGTRKPTGILVTNVGLWLNNSRTPYVGRELPDLTTGVGEPMQPMPALDDDENETTDLLTGFRMVNIDGAWTEGGGMAVRHVDPSPLEVLAIVPFGDFGRP